MLLLQMRRLLPLASGLGPIASATWPPQAQWHGPSTRTTSNDGGDEPLSFESKNACAFLLNLVGLSDGRIWSATDRHLKDEQARILRAKGLDGLIEEMENITLTKSGARDCTAS